MPAICTSVWKPGQHASHITQDYSIVRQSDQSAMFSGRGVYRIVDGRVDGHWEDSQGSLHTLSGTLDGGALKVIWGSAQTEIGRSEYVVSEGRLDVRDFVLNDEGWRLFMTIHYEHTDSDD